MKKVLPIVLVVVVIAVIVAVALGNKSKNSGTTTSTNSTSSSSSSSASSASDKVSIMNMSFSPASITVKKGASVMWTNDDSVTHTVTVDSGTGPNSGNLSPGNTYSYTFSSAGTFAYHCVIHPNMHGTVTVTE